MRLWDWRLLPYLPRMQLLSQKRECDLIWKDLANGKKTNHILINYIWEYEDYEKELSIYYRFLQDEFERRKYKFNPSGNACLWCDISRPIPFKNHHITDYLMQCFYNLQEKYDRGQKDFSNAEYRKLEKFIFEKLGKNSTYFTSKIRGAFINEVYFDEFNLDLSEKYRNIITFENKTFKFKKEDE